LTEYIPSKDGKNFRIPIKKHDNDDDGEEGAGTRLAQLLELRKDDGVLVVVSRWYGGIPLGPKRFAHIVNVARELLVQHAAAHPPPTNS
jgi:putative IMPACT (imprinted ancient) family translation regulator